MTNKYLLLYRTTSSEPSTPRSPQEMTAMLAQWREWQQAFPSIIDLGNALKPTGRGIAGKVVTDGPTVESKELISGYSIVAAADYEAAVVVARACPILFMPGARVEVRELADY